MAKLTASGTSRFLLRRATTELVEECRPPMPVGAPTLELVEECRSLPLEPASAAKDRADAKSGRPLSPAAQSLARRWASSSARAIRGVRVLRVPALAQMVSEL